MHTRARVFSTSLQRPTFPRSHPQRPHSAVESSSKGRMSSETQPLMKDARQDIPRAPWANSIPSRRDATRLLPQAIAHRGYKAAFPENTMAGFRGAVKVGSHGLETDLHLSADGVAVLSHDATLKRCYGVDKRISECRWEYLSTLETVREPRQRMPRLSELLEFLLEPGLEKTWVLLDIKVDDDADELLGAIAKALEDTTGPIRWDQRVILGCWNATFLQSARRILPTYPLAHIGASVLYAHHFLKVPNLGFNMAQRVLLGPPGWWFLGHIRAAPDKQLFVWTVNEERWMEWCIRKNLGRPRPRGGGALIDGVITDDPEKFLDVCERYEDELDGKLVRAAGKGMLGRLVDGVRLTGVVIWTQAVVEAFYAARRWQGKVDYLKDRRDLKQR